MISHCVFFLFFLYFKFFERGVEVAFCRAVSGSHCGAYFEGGFSCHGVFQKKGLESKLSMIAFFNGGWLNFHMLQIYLNHNLIIGQRLLKLHYEYATPRFLVGPYNSIVGKVGLAELMLQKEVSEAKVNRYQLKFGNFVFAIV